MADKTKIQWSEATWNVVNGCSVVSPGCTNCYAMRLAGTRMRSHPTRQGLTVQSKAGPVWNGEVRFVEQVLDQPLWWAKPRMIFVCAHGDLFYESVPDEWIDRVFAIMSAAQHHTFQVLTKRPDRMRDYVRRSYVPHQLCSGQGCNYCGGFDGRVPLANYPLPNVWLGTSVEDQQRADERIPILLDTPAAVRWISAEPLLGEVNLEPWLDRLDWVVIGGESGPGARSMDLDWARALLTQCRGAGTPAFMKQLGSAPTLHGFTGMPIRDRKGGDPDEWPADLRIREWPRTA